MPTPRPARPATSPRSLPLAAAAALAALLFARAPAARAEGRDPKPAAAPAAAVASRTFRFEYRVKVAAPEGAKRVEAWVPLPIEDDLQSVADLAVATTLAGAAVPHEVAKEDVYGDRMLHVALVEPKGEVAVSWTATVTRKADVGQGTGPVLDRFKEADALVPIEGKASELAKSLLADEAGDPVAVRAKRVYDHVLSTMTYDKEAPGWGKGDFLRACEVGKGNCTDFHAKFTGITRAAGIPVRFTMGIPLSTESKGAPQGYHCWAHFFDGKTWIPVDVSEAQKVAATDPAKAQWFFGHLDPDRVALSVGRDLVLAPKQAGPPLLFFAYPYVEADGKPVDVPKENRSFAYESR